MELVAELAIDELFSKKGFLRKLLKKQKCKSMCCIKAGGNVIIEDDHETKLKKRKSLESLDKKEIKQNILNFIKLISDNKHVLENFKTETYEDNGKVIKKTYL